MQSLALLEYGAVRVTEDNSFSVFDTIQVVGGKSNPRVYWKSLSDQYPEVVKKTYNFQFSGAGQRKTPVATQENILYIIGLLPGAIGRAYREDAAREMCKKLGVDYGTVVKAEESALVNTATIEEANLQLTIHLSQMVLKSNEEIRTRLNKVENAILGTAVDIKGEIREGNDGVESRLGQKLDAIQCELFELKQLVPEAKTQSSSRKELKIALYPSEERYHEWVDLADKSGMSRSQFFCELIEKALEVENCGG